MHWRDFLMVYREKSFISNTTLKQQGVAHFCSRFLPFMKIGEDVTGVESYLWPKFESCAIKNSFYNRDSSTQDQIQRND